MGTKPTIAIDIDDVLSSSAASFVEWSNSKYGTHLKPEDYQEHWAEMWKIELEEEKKRTEEFHLSDRVSVYEAMFDARKTLEKLKERFNLTILTSRRRVLEKLTQEWIEKHYPSIFDNCVYCGFYDTGDIGGLHLTKAELAQSLKVDYLIDDQLKHVSAAASVGIKGLLFGEYAWNKTDQLPDGVSRVKNWEEVLKYFDVV